jgi:carbon-monoxide dehydrogenase medium subunit
MYDFAYHRPGNLNEARHLMETAAEPAYLAGGMTLLPVMKQRLAMHSDLIDLGGIEELRGIRDDGEALVIGAMTEHATVAGSALVRARIPALAQLAESIGDPQVRNQGTLGGSIANNDPAADYPAGLLGLGATIKTDRREIGADDFVTGLFETALEEPEIITAISFPVPEHAAYMKFPQPASRFALVGVFAARGPAGTRLAVTGAAPCAFRVPEMEAALSTDFSPGALAGISIDPNKMNADMHADADYRAHLVVVLAGRAVAEATV